MDVWLWSGKPGDPRLPTQPYVSLSTHTALHIQCELAGSSGFPLTRTSTEHVSPFAPLRLQELHYYTGLILR
jgi:hypothetical protein